MTLTGRKCKVNWTKSGMAKENGGLGVLNLLKDSPELSGCGGYGMNGCLLKKLG